ncbi:MAG: DUF1127 domain-containing protein [Roseovarius sp.]
MKLTLTQTHASALHQTHMRRVISLWHRNHVTRKALRRLTLQQRADVGLTKRQARVESRKWFWQ